MRPRPPAELLEPGETAFRPAPEIVTWILEQFLEDHAPLLNDDHGHLLQARIGALWTNESRASAGETAALVAAARKRPEVAAAEVRAACGTCQGRAA